jgi:hypothetical protein
VSFSRSRSEIGAGQAHALASKLGLDAGAAQMALANGIIA